MTKKNKRTSIVNNETTVNLFREILEVETSDGMNLIMTRKRPAEGKPVGAVMLVHGLGQNRFSWTLPKRSMENFLVANGFETFNVELRGHGLSRANGSDYPSEIESYIDFDLPALIKEIYRLNGSKKFFYIGHSLGASLIYSIRKEHTKYLAGIISIGGPYQLTKGNIVLKAIAKMGMSAAKIYPFSSEPKSFHIDAIGLILNSGLFILDSNKYFFPLQLWYPGTIERDILVQRITKGFDRTSFNVIKFFFMWGHKKQLFSRNNDTNLEKRITDIETPFLFICGDRDYAVPVDSIIEAFDNAGASDKTMVTFNKKDTGTHWGHIDLICGIHAPNHTWLKIVDWMKSKS